MTFKIERVIPFFLLYFLIYNLSLFILVGIGVCCTDKCIFESFLVVCNFCFVLFFFSRQNTHHRKQGTYLHKERYINSKRFSFSSINTHVTFTTLTFTTFNPHLSYFLYYLFQRPTNYIRSPLKNWSPHQIVTFIDYQCKNFPFILLVQKEADTLFSV